jgi:hypothetical protein
MGPDFINKNDLRETPRNPWLENLFRPALLAGMITCLSIAIVNLIKAFNPSWHGTYFLIGMILVTIEAIYSYLILRKQGRIRDRNFNYRLVEWGTMMLLLKALTYVNAPWGATVADIQSWAAKPINIFTMEFCIICVLSFLIWSATTNTMKAFDALFNQIIIKLKDFDPYSNLTNRFYYGGGLLIFISGASQWISRSGLGVLTDINRPSISGVFFNVLIYFVLGLILLSQTQLNILFTGWKLQKVDVSVDVIKRWAVYGITILVIVGVVVFFLPTSYTLGFLSSVKFMLQYGIKVFIFLAQLIWTAILFPLKWLLSLFPLDDVAFRKDFDDSPMFSGGYEIGAPDSDVAYSFIFWLVLLAIVVYLLRTYLKDHPEFVKWLKNFRLHYSWLIKLWQWLKGSVHAVIELIPLPAIFHTDESDKITGSKRRRFRLGKMSTRQRIIYYYMSTLKNAEKSGFKRQYSQTPAEFALQIGKVLPDMNAEIGQLTESFVHARYSRHNLESKEAFLIKKIWKYVRSELRRSKK